MMLIFINYNRLLSSLCFQNRKLKTTIETGQANLKKYLLEFFEDKGMKKLIRDELKEEDWEAICKTLTGGKLHLVILWALVTENITLYSNKYTKMNMDHFKAPSGAGKRVVFY